VILAVAGPVVVGIVLIALFIVGDVAGYSPARYDPPQNAAEAAAMATASEVLRFLRAGQDPNAIMPVRPHVISASVTRATALEASIWGREVELVRLLDREGAIGDRRAYLACLSDALHADAITKYLAPQGPDHCDRVAILQHIQERSK